MSALSIKKVVTLPQTLDPNTMYMVKATNSVTVSLYFTDNSGTVVYELSSLSNAAAEAIVLNVLDGMLGQPDGIPNLDTNGFLYSAYLPNTGVPAGTYGSATQVVPVTVDEKGRIVSVGTAQTITPDWVNVQNKPNVVLDTDIVTVATANKVLRLDTNALLPTGVTGNAGTATKLAAARSISMTGDVTWTVSNFDGSGNVTAAGTLANSGVAAGTYNNVATQVRPFTVDAKGRVTGVGTAVTITPDWTNVQNKPDLLLSSEVVSIATGSKVLRLDTNGLLPTGITGNAATATKLATARTINGVLFDGSANITINAVDSTARIASSEKGAANGVATLDSNGLVPSSQLPGFVDDVLEYTNLASFPATGATGKLYVDLATNKVYRWSGTVYIEISGSPGSTDAVAEGSVNLYFTAARAQAAVTTVSGNAGTASKLATARSISMTGDVTWSIASFDGSVNVTAAGTLANTGVTAGTYNNVATQVRPFTVDAKGRITGIGTAVTITPDWANVQNKPDMLLTSEVVSVAAANKVLRLDASALLPTGITGNAATATKLTTARSIAMTGDVTWSIASFDGSANVTAAGTLAASGVTAGTYNNVATQVRPFTVDAKGRITGVGTAVTITPDWSSIQNKPTTVSTFGITDAVVTSDVVATATANKILKLDANALLPTGITGNAGTATKLATGRTVSLTGAVTGSATFDGSANVSIATTLAVAGESFHPFLLFGV